MKLIKDIISSDLSWDRADPAPSETIQELVEKSALDLPDDYLEFLCLCNGGEGQLPADPFWFDIWQAQQVLALNEEYRIRENIPGFFAFGSNGGGELLVFETGKHRPWAVYVIPFFPMEKEYATRITPDFISFASMFGEEEGAG